MDTVGKRLRAARQKYGYTMQQLHDLTGLSTGNISDIEHDRNTPSVSSLIPLSKALDLSLDWILTGEEPETRKSDFLLDATGDPASQIECDLVSMFRTLNRHDQDNVFDFVTMLYEKAIGKKGSVASTYTADERRRTSGPGANDEGQSGIA